MTADNNTSFGLFGSIAALVIFGVGACFAALNGNILLTIVLSLFCVALFYNIIQALNAKKTDQKKDN